METFADVLGLIGFVASMLIYGFASYWAFAIRGALSARAYRHQALGLGLVAIAIAYVTAFGFLQLTGLGGNDPVISQLIFYTIFIPFIILFYWIDASVLAARRTDPLLRDTLHWHHVRIILWSLIVIPLIVNVCLYLIFSFVLGSFPDWFMSWVIPFLLVFPPLGIPVVAGAILLPIAARRSKDSMLRRHLKWFGIFVITLALSILASALNPQLSDILDILAGYFLYRSAISLAPLKIPVEARGSEREQEKEI